MDDIDIQLDVDEVLSSYKVTDFISGGYDATPDIRKEIIDLIKKREGDLSEWFRRKYEGDPA